MATPPDASSCLDPTTLDEAYAYLLGVYLGDGMLSRHRRGVWRLRISLDVRYPAIIARTGASIRAVSGRRPGATRRPGCLEVCGYWKHWRCALPQHGDGPKHLRPIRLAPWQLACVRAQPEALIAGLIHSDGCRVLNRVRGRAYPRYFFSNLSPDIRALFQEACGWIGVESRMANARNVAVSRRASVAILDAFVGPKA